MMLENQTSLHSPAAAGAASLVARLAQMLEAARLNLDTDYEATRRLVAEAYSLLELHLARGAGCQVRRREKGGLARWQIDRVHTFIEEHLTDCIRVSDLSAIARSSPSYFSCAFKKTFGTSAHAYVMSRRIRMAAELMLNSDAPLSQIAINCGFADQAHFSRHFRRAMGYTPSSWRREQASRPFAR